MTPEEFFEDWMKRRSSTMTFLEAQLQRAFNAGRWFEQGGAVATSSVRCQYRVGRSTDTAVDYVLCNLFEGHNDGIHVPSDPNG